MTVLIVLPEADEDIEDVDRAIKLTADRFNGYGEITYSAPKKTLIRYAAVVRNYTLGVYVPGESEAGHDTVVYITERETIEEIEWSEGQRVYRYQINRLNLSGRGPFIRFDQPSLMK